MQQFFKPENSSATPFSGLSDSLTDQPDGYLLLDSKLRVVDVNDFYHTFHKVFNTLMPEKYAVIEKSTFEKFPMHFLTKLSSIISGDLEDDTLQVHDLNDSSIIYDVTLKNMVVDEKDTKGIGVFIHSMKPALLQPMEKPASQMFEVLVQHSTDVYQLADAGSIITYTSDAVEAVLGYPAKYFYGRSILDSIHPDDRDDVRSWLAGIRSIREKLMTIEYRVRNQNGDWIWIENNGRNMLHHPHVGAIVFNFRNIQAKKIADHALVQTEQRLSLLLNNTEESFIILNSRLRIRTYNKAAQIHSPYFFNQEIQSGMSVLELVGKTEVNEYIELFERVFKGEEIEKETLFTSDKNVAYIFNHTYRPLFDQHGDIFGVFITSTNITDRKKLTEELAINTERLKTAQKIARLAYFEYNFINHSFFCSPQFYTILGIEEKEYNWATFEFLSQIVHPEDKELLRGKLKAVLETGGDFNIEFRVKSDSESPKVIQAIGGMLMDAEDRPFEFRVTIQDITASRMALLAIQTLESRFRSLFENSIDGVILSDDNGQLISGNPSVCRMLGYTSEELMKLHRSQILDFASQAVQDMFAQRATTGSYMGELRLRHKAGHYISAEVTSLAMNDGEGHSYVSTIVRDITEKKKIEKEQKALTEELLKNNQDLQQFSFITSHNLRAPVANLMSLLSLYNKQDPADDFNQVLIDKFGEATHQLNQTLNDLVNVLVIKSNNNIDRENVQLSTIFSEVKRNVENLLDEQDGRMEADFSEVNELHYNRIHIESIFLNMISNAIRYRSPHRKPFISIRSYFSGGWAIVDFKDNGLGMDLKRYGDRLFGLYQRFHENKEGKGLGLYMTRSQVTAMGGKIEVESEPGVGTTFKIYFKLEN